MRRIISLASFAALVPTGLLAQPPAHPEPCCARVEIIANKSAGFDEIPEYMSVWIEPDSRHWAFDRGFVREAREAFGAWSDAGVPVVFDFTPDSARATVRVFWRNRFREPHSGRSTWWVADGALGRAEIEVALTAQPGLSGYLVRAIVMHEIGHLLGFSHSNEPDSIMSYYLNRAELSLRDIERMRQRFLRTSR